MKKLKSRTSKTEKISSPQKATSYDIQSPGTPNTVQEVRESEESPAQQKRQAPGNPDDAKQPG